MGSYNHVCPDPAPLKQLGCIRHMGGACGLRVQHVHNVMMIGMDGQLGMVPTALGQLWWVA